MNNPYGDRETWHEFQQEIQDWSLAVWDIANRNGWLSSSHPVDELLRWTEDRFRDGESSLHPEDEFLEFLEVRYGY